MQTFVTGVTGLLGNNIVKALLDQKHEVTALVRSMEKGRKILSADVSLIEGDMENVDGFADKLGGMDVLIHAAACYSEFYRTGDKIRQHSPCHLL